MGYWKAITTDGVRVYFKVVRNGNLRTGLLAGVFTVLLINMDDNDSTALTVNESTEKPGVYYVDIPTSFITTYGAGFYGLSIGVHAVGPITDDEVLYSVEVTTLDLNNVVTDTVNAVWDENSLTHLALNSTGRALALSGSIITETTLIGTPTTTQIQLASGSAVDDYYNDLLVIPTSGAIIGQARIITDYIGATKTIIIDEPWTSAPAFGDYTTIRSIHTHTVSQIADSVWDVQKAGHVTANSYGKIVQDLETLIKQVKALTAAQL